MKKRNMILIVALLVGLIPAISFAQNRSITFEDTTWKDILAKAKSENKLIFLDAYASWCGPCKFLASQIFTKDSVADFYNTNFVNAHFDMEKGEGIELRAKYGVNVFPSLFFINSAGEVVHKAVGSMQAKAFIQLGQDAMNPEKQLITYKKKYESGWRDAKFILEYLGKLKDSYSNYDEVSAAYFAGLSDKQLTEKENWLVIKDYQNNADSREIKYIVKNKSKFSKAFTESEVDGKLRNVFTLKFEKVLRAKVFSQTAYDSVKEIVEKSGYDKTEDVFAVADFSLYQRQKDMDKFVPAAEKVIKFMGTDAGILNAAAWTVFENTIDKDKLSAALLWAKKGIDVEKSAGIVDTYANILFKLGKKEEAIKYETEAVELAKKEGEGAEQLQQTLEQMKKQ
jgi:thiol-disulfide isomerase/thioredoxin